MAFGKIGWIALAAAVGIVVFQVLVPPPIGIADNGDFDKIIRQLGMRAPYDPSEPGGFPYVHLRYEFAGSPWRSGYHSLELLLVEGAVGFNRLVSRDGMFDIRCMGVLHASLFLLAFAFFVPLTGALGPALRVAVLALAILFFCDAMNTSHYNSFYMDTAAFVFLMLTLVFLVRAVRPERHGPADAWLGVLFIALMVVSKAQHAFLAVPLALFVLWKARAMWPRRALASSLVAVALIAGSAAYSFLEATPPGYAGTPLFNMIFKGLLPTAEDPSAELASLGLDDSYLRWKDMHSYSPDSPMVDEFFVREFMHRTSLPRLALFYITHPRHAWRMAGLAAEEGALQRPPFGSYDKSAGHAPGAQSSAFSAWSAAKRIALGRFLWLYPLLFGIAVTIVARRFPAAGVVLGLMGAIEFGMSAMTDCLDVTRHLFIFNAIWDVSLFAALGALLLALDARLRRRAAPSASRPDPAFN